MIWENPNLDEYVVSTDLTTEFLVDDYGDLWAEEDRGPVGPVSESIGDLFLSIDSEASQVVRVFFHIAGVSPVDTGLFDLQGGQSEQQSNDDNGLIVDNSFVIDVEAAYLDEAIVANSELKEVSAHVLASPRDFFRGVLRGTLYIDGEKIFIEQARLTLVASAEQGQYSRVQALQTRVENRSGVQRQMKPCASGLVPVYPKHLQLEVVRFEPPPGQAQATGAHADDMLTHAEKLWLPGRIDWIVERPGLNPHYALAAADPTNSNNLTALSACRSKKQPGWIPIFFVSFDLRTSGHGGGNMANVSINGGTALATIAISEGACDLALAHELGHVMRGMHFNELPLSGHWLADQDTILSPSPFVAKNSAGNYARARMPSPGTAAQGVPECFPENETWSIEDHKGCNR